MNEEQKWQALRADFVMIDTDASPVNPATTASSHPRAFGAFPRVIAKYVREDGVLTLEDAVRRMSSLAAQRLGLYSRGIVAPVLVKTTPIPKTALPTIGSGLDGSAGSSNEVSSTPTTSPKLQLQTSAI